MNLQYCFVGLAFVVVIYPVLGTSAVPLIAVVSVLVIDFVSGLC